MSQEKEGRFIKLKTIRIDLEQGVLETAFADGTIERYVYNSEGIFRALLHSGSLESAARQLLIRDRPEPEVDQLEQQQEQQPQLSPTGKAKTPALVLSGRLKNQPVEGRPDGSGKLTAIATFLAHRPERETAEPIFATFHNRTREIALGLSAGDRLTAQGYYHPSRNPDRLATFSIFHLINYPGKPARPQ